jgi:glutathione synthase/RimK-type ligase-like ATP-grasp enzyme
MNGGSSGPVCSLPATLSGGTANNADAAKSKVLVIATQNTAMAARISMALADVGFLVAALTPHGHPARRTRKIQHHFAYERLFKSHSLIRAIARWSPALLICADDLAAGILQTLHRRTAASDDKARRQISELIEMSVGPATSFPATRNKSTFLSLVEGEGLRTPKTIVFPAGCSLQSKPAKLTYPMVVKADQSYGGNCVRIVNSDAAVRAALWELQTPATWRRVFRRLFGAILASEALGSLMLPLRRTVSLQQYIPGRPSNRAVICWKGNVLAGISVEVVEVTHECGPASVIKVVDHPEMTTAAERIVKRLTLSGFVGFDFVLDSANCAWLIEMNPRVTPISHFSLIDGTDLTGSLYTQMTGSRPLPRLEPVQPYLIALFPNEIARSPFGKYLRSCSHDVPWNEPELVCTLLNAALRPTLSRQLRTILERTLPKLVSAFVKLGLVDPRRDN